MQCPTLRILLFFLSAGSISAFPLSPRSPELQISPIGHAPRYAFDNSTSSRTSTTIFFPPNLSTTATGSASSVNGLTTVTLPGSATTSSQSVHVITITSPWPSITPTITVPPVSVQVTTVTAPQPPAPAVVTVIDTTVTVYISSGILTVEPVVTVTASTPEAPLVITITAG